MRSATITESLRASPWASVAVSVAIAAAGGVTIAIAGAPREWPGPAWLGVPLLLVAIEWALAPGARRPLRRAFLAGLVFGTVTNAIALFWVKELLEVFAGFPLIASIPVAALLWVAQAVAFGLAATFAAALMREGAPGWLVVPACIVVASSWTPALFPWRVSGTQIPFTIFVQIAELGGEPLVDLAFGTIATAGLEAIRRGPTSAGRLQHGLSLLLLVLVISFGAVRLEMVRKERLAAPLLNVGVVQPNVGIFEKHDPALWPYHLDRLRAMTAELEAQGADLVVWPETAYPYPWPRSRLRDMPGELGVRRQGVRGPVLLGTITRTDVFHRWNSAVALDAEGNVTGIADKVQLLAFGEYVPLWHLLPPLQDAFRSPGLTPGRRPRILPVAGARIAVLNCYEDVLARYGWMVAQDDPDLLVNVTNDAWFGDSAEPHLHHQVARMRTIETRRDLVRAVNTGVSAHVLATGEDAIRTETWTRRSFVARARLLSGRTPWTILGDWVTPLCAGALLGAALAAWRRRR